MRKRSKKFGLPAVAYDKLSILHSNGYFYSSNGKSTIDDKSTKAAIKSQRKNLTSVDIRKINSLYPLCTVTPTNLHADANESNKTDNGTSANDDVGPRVTGSYNFNVALLEKSNCEGRDTYYVHIRITKRKHLTL